MSVARYISSQTPVKKEIRKLLTRERKARCLAEAANKKKDDHIAEISHELRTPINAILCCVSLLQSQKVDEETLEQIIQIIDRSAKAQLHFVEDLLDHRRIISGKLQLEPRPVSLVPLVKSSIELLKWTAESKSIQIDVKIDSPEMTVMGDPERLQQVVCNLLSNAIKFTPNGGQIEIGVQRTLQHALITVKDSGEGINPEVLTRLFEGFYQGDNLAGRRNRGLGLGLWIAYRLVELHKGTIHAESPGIGFGSKFIVKLPLWAAN